MKTTASETLLLASYDIVFREIPGEVTLALNLSGCPNRCPGCHSPHLQSEVGRPLDGDILAALLGNYGNAATCVCFMGGDCYPAEVERLAGLVREKSGGKLKTAWYSGRDELPDGLSPQNFDYVKLGPYIESLGGLDSPTTNQRLCAIADGAMTDITEWLRRGGK